MALATTISEAPVSAMTAIQSVATPATASARNAALSTSDTTMFARMLRIVARLNRIGVGDLRQFVGHQRDVSGLERRIAADGAHRNPDVRGRQGRRVVDAVADHRHAAVALLQRFE